MMSLYRPGFNSLVREICPAKSTLLAPLRPAKESVAAVTALQLFLCRIFLWIAATQLWPRRHVPWVWTKLKVTEACSLSENEKVVPVGVLPRLMRAS